MLADATLAFGERVTPALLGVDALYRDESGDEAGLAVLNMDTEGRHPPARYASWEEAAAAWAELRRAALELPEADRRLYYRQLSDSTLAFVRWRRGEAGFRARLSGFLHVPAEPAPDTALEALRADVRRLLQRMGYHGDLEDQCAAWEARNRVPPDEVEGVTGELFDEAWERTEERLVEIPADRSDGMEVKAVSGVAYNARCDYPGRTVELNVDPVLTRPGLKHLAVHEGCPGHYVQFKLRETWAREGSAPADVLLSVVNTASSCVFEGIADAGMEMIGWGDSDDDRVQALLNRYRAGIGTAAAWRLHGLGRPAEEVADWLRSRALLGGEGWVRNRMAFIGAPSRAVLIWSYWWGERCVAPAWRAVPPRRRDDFVRFLHGRMHSNDSVGMFP
ncbi:MAG: hypothetical protein PVI57_07110 [Gemmatimonadota bacterium]|jgi:hypothetical protein